MHINKVTLTGIDSYTHPTALLRLEERYPFVEWGILFSTNQQGRNRYPTIHQATRFLNANLKNVSAHLCGDYARQIMERGDMSFLHGRNASVDISSVGRIQINYNFSRSKDWTFRYILEYAWDNPNKGIIFQCNPACATAISRLLEMDYPDNIHFLYDASGGRGLPMHEVLSVPFKNYSGYAGGINPENVDSVCAKITSADPDCNTWIDMESGIRTGDMFDVYKAEQVLKICNIYIL